MCTVNLAEETKRNLQKHYVQYNVTLTTALVTLPLMIVIFVSFIKSSSLKQNFTVIQ